MLKKIVIANWKMNPESLQIAEKNLLSLSKLLKNVKNKKDIDIIIAPPAVYIDKIKSLKKSKRMIFELGAQNTDTNEPITNTGGVSAKMLENIGINYCIVGHSEVRAKGENDNEIHNKIIDLLASDILPILCVGEKIRDEKGQYLKEIESQLRNTLHSLSKSNIKNIIIAYEPIWAIGKDAVRDATPEEVIEVTIMIKKVLADMFGGKEASHTRIIFGGSVNEENAGSYIVDAHMNGLLVGRASLDPKQFINIIQSVIYAVN